MSKIPLSSCLPLNDLSTASIKKRKKKKTKKTTELENPSKNSHQYRLLCQHPQSPVRL